MFMSFINQEKWLFRTEKIRRWGISGKKTVLVLLHVLLARPDDPDHLNKRHDLLCRRRQLLRLRRPGSAQLPLLSMH